MSSGLPPIYTHNTAVSIIIDFKDGAGQAVTPDTALASLYDADGTVLVADINVPVGGSSGTINVAAEHNLVPEGKARAARKIVLKMFVGANTVTRSVMYLLEREDVLMVMENSYQTFAQALLTALDIPDLGIWWEKSDVERMRGLVAAFENIGRLRFRVPVPSTIDIQSIEPYGDAEQGTYIHELNRLSKADFEALDDQFKNAIFRAQVVEADILLNGDLIGTKRRDGLMSETIGESSNFFRPSKPLELGVSKAAARHLSRYLDLTVRIRR